MTQPNQTEENHARMVTALAKSPADMQDLSTPWKWALIHAAIGIAGELGEFDNAVDASEHMLEEAGDTLFYCRDFRHVLDLPSFSPVLVLTRGLTALNGAVLDHAKRLTIYNYEMDDTRRAGLLDLVDEIESYISVKLENANYTRQDALEHNITKLLTGPEARFKEGSYTDLAAQLRSDKNPNNDDV